MIIQFRRRPLIRAFQRYQKFWALWLDGSRALEAIILDRETGILRSEWQLAYERMRWKQVGGIAGRFGIHRPWFLSNPDGLQAASTLALNNAYSYGVSGNAYSLRIVTPASETITDAYFFISSFTGTAANVADINIEHRNSTGSKPGATLKNSTTKNPASTTGWLGASGLSWATDAKAANYIVIGDANGGATDFATMQREFNNSQNVDEKVYSQINTTDGFNTVNTADPNTPNIVVKLQSGGVLGNPITANASSTSGTYQRGVKVAGFTEQIGIAGILSNVAASALTAGRVWEGTNGPTGTGYFGGVEATSPIYDDVASETKQGFFFDADQNLAKNTVYRFVFTYGSASTTPQRYQIGTGADANLKAAMPFAGGAIYTQDTASAWVDTDSELGRVCLLLSDQVSITGSPFAGSVM